MNNRAIAAALLLGTAPPLSAEPPAPPTATAEDAEIVVVGMGDGGYRLTADQLRDAVRAFEHDRARYAPSARLAWRFRPADAGAGVSLALTDGTERIEIVPDADGTFTLPHDRIISGNYRMVTSARPGSLRIQPFALSESSNYDDFTAGEARLTCKVIWAFENNHVPLPVKALFPIMGGCESAQVGIYMRVDRPLAEVTVERARRPMEYGKDHMSFRLPIQDKALPNGARIRLRYAP